MSTNLRNAVIFGAGLAVGMAIGNAMLSWGKRTLS
jgi:hypothetical protein